ncbi:MAG: hypothetical protein HRU19_24355 [Pseudobacteriovorax sp.]|nr:hypothetical protein [Pseudobacteriovorax sp.]
MLSKLQMLSSLVIWALCIPAFAQDKTALPILAHEHKLKIGKLLEISALEFGINKITSSKKADAEYKSLLQSLDSLRADAEPQSEKLFDALIRAVAVAHYYNIQGHRKKSEERAIQARDWIYNFANQYASRQNPAERVLEAKYFALIAEFGQTDGRGGTVQNLVTLTNEAGLSPIMKANIDLMVGYSLALSSATKEQSKQYLSKAPSSSVFGRIAHRLTQVLLESGIDGSGQVIGPESPQYKKNLNYTLDVAKGAPKGVQILVVDTAFYLWKARDPNMQNPPFRPESFGGVYPADSYMESVAIKDIAAGNYEKAISKYESLTKYYVRSRYGTRLDRRIWSLHLRSYRKNRDVSRLQGAFQLYWPKYARAKKGESKSLKSKIKNDYKKFSKALIIKGFKSKPLAQKAVSNIDFLLNYLDSRGEAYEFKFRKAQLLTFLGQNATAVDVYLDIAKDKPEINYANAIKAQSQIAQWPTQPPWLQTPAAGFVSERRKLLLIYDRSTKYKGSSTNWVSLAHMGLLYRALNNQTAAESLWLKFLKTDVKSDPHAMEAAGTIFTEYYNKKQWNKLIDLGYLALKSKFAMTYRLKPVSFQKPFSDALFAQGELDSASRNYGRSTQYLSDFIKFFNQDPRRAAAYHTLAKSYVGLGKNVFALNSKKVLVDKYPKYPKMKEVLLEGGRWATKNKKTIEYTFFFFGKYLTMFPNEPNTGVVREQLAEIYYRQKLYGWASRLYKEQSLSKLNSPQVQLKAALKYLDIEEKYGQPKDAAFGATRVLQLAAEGSQAAGIAYAFLAKYAVSRNDVKAMRAIEPKLMQYIKTSPDAKQALGSMKFKMAQIFTKPIRNTEANAFLKDPEGAVKGFYDKFLTEKKYYESVCSIGITQSCGPAMFRLVEYAESAMIAVADVEIASTLEANRVNAFKVFKQLHSSKLEQAAKAYAQKALQLARSGTTTPLWKTEIVKSLANKTKFGVAGE